MSEVPNFSTTKRLLRLRSGGSAGDVEDLTRINEIRILNPIHPRNFFKRSPDSRSDSPERITRLDGDLSPLTSLQLLLRPVVVGRVGVDPAETPLVIFEKTVQVDAASLVGPIDTLAGCMQGIAWVETHVAGGTGEVSSVGDTMRVKLRGGFHVVVIVVVLLLFLLLFLVTLVVPVGNAVLQLMTGESTANDTKHGWEGWVSTCKEDGFERRKEEKESLLPSLL